MVNLLPSISRKVTTTRTLIAVYCFAAVGHRNTCAVALATTFLPKSARSNSNLQKKNLIQKSHILSSGLFSTATGNDTMTKKTVLVPIADGSEEIETTCITDTLVRFGAAVTIASVKESGELVCTMSRGIKVQADCSINDCIDKNYDMIILPGGMPGAEHLRDCISLKQMLEKQKESGQFYGAICAAPAVALHSNGLFDADMKATCYPAPAFREKIQSHLHSDDPKVVISKNCITSQGPATALEFGLTLGELLYGREKRDEIAKGMLVN